MKRIIFEDPAPINFRKPKAKSTLSDFIQKIAAEAQDRWVVVTRTSKTQNYYFDYQRKFPNLRVTTRKNDGRNTWTVYFMWENDEATAKRLAKNAERKYNRKSKREETQENATPVAPKVFGFTFPQAVHE